MKYVKHPIATEKAVRMVEQNILTFIVDRKATKDNVKKEIEKEFKVKVESVKSLIDTKGRKKVVVQLSKSTPAIDVATQIGIM